MVKSKKISVEIEPYYSIGQTIYIPEIDLLKKYIPEIVRLTKTAIKGYEVQVIKGKNGLVAVVSHYRIEEMVPIRRGEESDLVDLVREGDFYVNKKKAEKAARFLPVEADEETWKLAIGDRDEKDGDSHYNIDNSGLPSCCANISDARDILLYCQENKGLLVHDRDELLFNIGGHELAYEHESPLGKIFRQLEIK